VAHHSATPRRLAAAAALSAALCAPAVASAATTVRDIAGALRSDPVYVARSQNELLTVPERGRVRLRIVREDIGRIQVAVVSPRSAERAGGLGELANAIDQAMPGRRGALVVTTGSAFHVVTSHGVVRPTAAALQAAVQAHRGDGLESQLLAGVNGIAEVDPGAGADVNAPVPSVPVAGGSGDSNDVGDDIGDSFRIGVLIVAAAIALPFVLGAAVFLLGVRRRRAAAHDREQIDRGDARDQLVALGEEIEALDLDVEMPNASPRGRDHYDQALKLYDRANRLLSKEDPSEVELYEARRSLEEGRARVAAARDALTPGQAS
jgi:ABC-type amino acid transport substrate-binding protein